MKTKIISIFKSENEIKKIIEKVKAYSFDEFYKHFHYEFSVMQKLTDNELIKKTFPKFELIRTIEIRENEKGERSYSLNYELEDGTYVVISVVLDRDKLFIINTFHVQRNYQKFEQSLRRNYFDKFIG